MKTEVQVNVKLPFYVINRP